MSWSGIMQTDVTSQSANIAKAYLFMVDRMNSQNFAMKVVAMASLEKKLASMAVSIGAELVGITTTELLVNSPPSADPRKKKK